MIVKISDAILKTIASYNTNLLTPSICVSALADALIYVCQGERLTRKEFMFACQEMVNQYDEVFLVEEQ